MAPDYKNVVKFPITHSIRESICVILSITITVYFVNFWKNRETLNICFFVTQIFASRGPWNKMFWDVGLSTTDIATIVFQKTVRILKTFCRICLRSSWVVGFPGMKLKQWCHGLFSWNEKSIKKMTVPYPAGLAAGYGSNKIMKCEWSSTTGA